MSFVATPELVPKSQSSFGLPRIAKLADLAKIINFLTVGRQDPGKWAFFHIRIGEESRANLGEALQIVEFNLLGAQICLLRLDDRNELIVFCSTHEIRAFPVVENEIVKTLTDQDVRVQSDTLHETGIEQLAKILTTIVPEDDLSGRIALRRFSRLSNVIMVLDDDLVVLRQMEHMLKSYGLVVTRDKVRDFLTAYNRYAPNVVFLDIHLQGERGTDVLNMLAGKVDPGCHAIMISADAIKTNVLESKFKGAKAFIGKPVNIEMMKRHMQTAPLYQKK